MSHDIYTAASGAVAGMRRMDAISNNLANGQTTGFKPERLRYESIGSNASGQQVLASSETAHLTDGTVVPDGTATHLAITGDGFFEVQDGASTVLVRGGRFGLDQEGTLVDPQGRAVLGEGGPIQLDPTQKFEVASDGSITDAAGADIAKLRLVTAGSVIPLGGSSFRPVGPTTPSTAQITQGALEESAADPLGEMVSLIETSRIFEMLQKAVTTSDDLDATANKIGGTP